MSVFSLAFSFLPVVILIGSFYLMQKKKAQRIQRQNNLGRRGKKDHLWLIIKEYLKMNDMQGLKIEQPSAFERPSSPKTLHSLIKKCEIYKAKKEAERKSIPYKVPKCPKRFEIEDYFDQLERDTALLNQGTFVQENQFKSTKSHRSEFIKKKKRKQSYPRKRYVIIFKTKNVQTGEISDWICIEVEIFYNSISANASRDKVVVNKELDYEKELSWILPLKVERETRRRKEMMKMQAQEKRRDALRKILFFLPKKKEKTRESKKA